uniref:Enhancer of rudimentary-like protein n=1 Tax=Cucumis melo TaxID=3656 RepID=A0A9I9E8Y9_CUCME
MNLSNSICKSLSLSFLCLRAELKFAYVTVKEIQFRSGIVLIANRHTILLMQTSHNRATRTFMDYDSISQAMDGICGLYERKLKDLNPAIRNITYDIADLYNFIDGLADMSALVYAALSLSLFPFHSSLRNKDETVRVVGQATVSPSIFKIWQVSFSPSLMSAIVEI